MKLKLYFSYTTRSLLRGGGRTALAVFCVAVGVMAIVALQLVGLMANNALTSNIREINGGDVAISPSTGNFTAADLQFFSCLKAGISGQERVVCTNAHLKANGEIVDFTAYSDNTATGFTPDGRSLPMGLRIVNTSRSSVSGAPYPLVGSPGMLQPADSDFQHILDAAPNNAIVTKTLYDELGVNLGDTVRVTTTQHAVITVKIVGELKDEGAYSGGNPLMIVSRDALRAAAPDQADLYNIVNVTTINSALASQVEKDVKDHFALVNVTTADEALQQAQQQVDYLRKFLQIVGLMALLIGGVGIVNTMQVMLRRRSVEIAMLKTTGYRRRDLYLLFGLEAGLLGLVGGVIGALAAIGLGYALKSVVESALDLTLPFIVDWPTVGSGVLVGLATALIFGLLPIVKAATIRPQNVLRELDEGRGAGSKALTVGLLVLLSFLFFLLAAAIMNSVIWSLSVVYGSLIVLGLLSLGFALVVLIISLLPVPERATPSYLLLVTGAVVGAAILTIAAPGFGVLVLFATLMGYVVVFLPRTWKANVKLCFRNIGRQKTRTVTTLLALFVGVFSIGTILVLGQDISDKLQNAITTTLPYNVIAGIPVSQRAQIDRQLAGLPGLQHGKDQPLVVNVATQLTPLCINGKPTASYLTPQTDTDILGGLSSMQGYDLSRYPQGLPQITLAPRARNSNVPLGGRMLNQSDSGTTNVMAPVQLSGDVFKLRVGNTITVLNPLLVGPGAGAGAKVECSALQTARGQKGVFTFTIVGFYSASRLNLRLGSLLGSQELVSQVGGRGTEIAYFMKVSSDQTGNAVRILGRAAPDAFILDITDFGVIINQILNKVITMLLSIAALALLAGIIIIANAVGLAMLERRREVGILKSVGYTSRTVLGQVLLENGLIGGLGGLLAMALVTLLIYVLSKVVFKTSLEVGVPITLAIVFGTMALAMITAALVAWRATRIRPLEVLRYE
jgi:ABC-type antimicrobial peptide transport system permease subunit